MRDRIPYPVFVDLFERCNLAIWPLQIVGNLAALLVLVLVLTQWRHTRRLVYAILAPFWVFIGVVFQLLYLRPLYRPGLTFGVLWITQGLLPAIAAIRSSGELRRCTGWYAFLGWAGVLYALVGYPVAGFLLRGSLSRIAWIGGFPCPTALFTIAILLLAHGPVPKWLLISPAFWAVGGIVPFWWGIREDSGLVILGLLAIGSIGVRDRHPQNVCTLQQQN